jgi:chromate reductase, NAD(P)H dehydrogenase (quinone)
MIKYLIIAALVTGAPLAAETKVIAFAGSTRKDSCNKKLIQESARIARQMGAAVTVIDLKDYPIPFYDGDLEANQGMPENAKRIRKMIVESNAIIISTPEYNGSLSSVLKNTLDWVSRTEDGKPSREAFLGKKVAIMSCSPGNGGGARALEHLKGVVQDIGGLVVATNVALSSGYSAFNVQGQLEDGSKKQELTKEIQELLQK